MTRAEMVTEYARCEESAWYFLTHHVTTLDPKVSDPSRAMRLFPAYPHLKDACDGLDRMKPQHWLKSRQMALTTLICAWVLWGLLFRDAFSAIMVTRKEELVNDGGANATWNSLFGKILFMYRKLPDFLKHGLLVSGMKISNPARESFVIGESGRVKDAGRGGTHTIGVMDEAASIPASQSVYSSLKDACRFVVMNSTPKGKQGVFYRIHRSDETRFERQRFHWSRHPHRDQAWYAEECIDRTPEQIAEELDLSFERSVQGRCVPEFNYEQHVDVELRYNAEVRMLAGWDFGIGHPTAVTFAQQIHEEFLFYDDLQRADLTTEQFAPLATALLRRVGCTEPTRSILCHGDPAGRQRSRQTGRSDIADYRRLGWNILPSPCNEPLRFKLFRRLCTTNRLHVHPNCVNLIDSLEQLRYPTDEDGKVLTDEHSDPSVKEFTHMGDAAGYCVKAHERVGGPVEPMRIPGV